jgi:hypothetical protein
VFALCLAAALLLVGGSCIHETDYDPGNDPPEVRDRDSIAATVFYPDSIVCTLIVRDLNDADLSFRACTAFTECVDTAGQALDSVRGPGSPSSMPWPGTVSMLNPGLDDKYVALYMGGPWLGHQRGCLLIGDDQGATATVPYDLRRIYRESFSSFPLDTAFWRPYDSADTTHIALDYADLKLEFHFEPDSADSLQPRTAGVCTRYRLQGDFTVCVDFELRDDMYHGFETGFFASSSADTGRFAGRIFGVFLTGKGDWVNVKSRAGLQTAIQEIRFYEGSLRIRREGTTASFAVRRAGPVKTWTSLATHTVSESDSVYIHLKMRVNDRRRARHCTWDDFTVEEGKLAR